MGLGDNNTSFQFYLVQFKAVIQLRVAEALQKISILLSSI